MDPALPPGGIDQIFRQYDAVRIHSTRDDGPAPYEPEPDQVTAPPAPPAPPASSAPPQSQVGLQAITDATEARPRGRPKAWETDPGNAQLMEERLRQAQEKKVYETRLKNPQGATFKQDEAGMDAAYAYRSFPGAAYDENTQTLYVAGSDSWRSWYDDFRNIPAWGDLKNSERYKQADRAYEDLTKTQGKTVRRVVGHSLGGSVALELAKNHPDIQYSRTFGAPVADLNPFQQTDRYRHGFDPVSLGDRSATWGKFMAYPHSYTGFQEFDEPAPYIFDVGQKTKPKQETLTV